jgi:hypothetical protein
MSSGPDEPLERPRELARMISEHASDESLDQYSRGTLAESQVGQLEEHLLICEQCCERLTKFDDSWGLNG